MRQTAQHREFWHMGGQDPDQRAGVPSRLKEGKGTSAAPLGLVHAGRAEREKIAELLFKPHHRSMKSWLFLCPAFSLVLALCRDFASAAHCGF